MLPALNIESLSQNRNRTATYELFIQYADATFVALLANAIKQDWAVPEFA